MTEEEPDWNEFRDWLKTMNGSLLIGTCSVNNKEELRSIESIAPEVGLAIDDVNEHENGYTVYLAENRE